MVYVQDRMSTGAHDLLLAAGYTDHETFGGEVTWNAEYGLRLSSGTRLSAAAGKAFHAPSSSDRFGYGGNPALDPEVSRQLEIGVRQPLAGGRHELFAFAFENRVEDLINFRLLDPLTFELRAENIEEARIRG
ncbi:MAG: TonB-dependent receptor, partial [Caldilineales bacterium]|nr:TonB-dependent receptor [Caldilineales bacterium]